MNRQQMLEKVENLSAYEVKRPSFYRRNEF